jgi:hypothetical protein
VGERFSLTIQTGTKIHPAPVKWLPAFFLGEKRLGRFINYPLTSRAEVTERTELYLYLPSVTSQHVFYLAQQPPMGQGLLIHEVSRSHSTTRHSR